MNKALFFTTLSLLAGSISLAAASPKEEVIAAAKQLGEKPNYSWRMTSVVPENSQFRPGPTDGKIEKDGYTHISSSFGDNTMQTVLKGEKGAITNQDGDWQSLDEVEKEEGFGRFRAVMARNFKSPAVQAAEMADGTKELKKDGDVYASELTEDGAKALMRFGRGGNGPTVSGASGSVKFWIKDGTLVKYEFKVKGTVSFNGNDREVDRTTTVEIKDVGTTKVEVPEGARKKLS